MKTLKVIPAQTKEQKQKRKRISATTAIASEKLEQKNYERRAKHQNDHLVSKVKGHYKHFDNDPDKYLHKYLNGTIQRSEESKNFIRETKKRHGLRTWYGLKHIQQLVPVWDETGKVIDAIETIVPVATRERYTNICESLTLRKWFKRTKRKKSGEDVNDQRLRRIIESDSIVDRDHFTTAKVMKLETETWSQYKKRKREIFDLMYRGYKVLGDDHTNKAHIPKETQNKGNFSVFLRTKKKDIITESFTSDAVIDSFAHYSEDIKNKFPELFTSGYFWELEKRNFKKW